MRYMASENVKQDKQHILHFSKLISQIRQMSTGISVLHRKDAFALQSHLLEHKALNLEAFLLRKSHYHSSAVLRRREIACKQLKHQPHIFFIQHS